MSQFFLDNSLKKGPLCEYNSIGHFPKKLTQPHHIEGHQNAHFYYLSGLTGLGLQIL